MIESTGARLPRLEGLPLSTYLLAHVTNQRGFCYTRNSAKMQGLSYFSHRAGLESAKHVIRVASGLTWWHLFPRHVSALITAEATDVRVATEPRGLMNERFSRGKQK
jgi:hypothetical protein